MKKRKLIIFAVIAAIILTVGSSAAVLWYLGCFQTDPASIGYTVKGVDVSEYQGEIDWQQLSSQGIDFAFIKATEGSSYTDERFSYNLEESGKTCLRRGYYHFFSFESAGKTQAENFIRNVPVDPDMLPPVIDVELYGRFRADPPDAETVAKELSDMIEALTEHYGQRPILYTTGISYSLYVKGRYDDLPVWTRSVRRPPSSSDWTFWQYSCTTKLDGYNGKEKYIDMNVFSGSSEEFSGYNTYITEEK